VAKLFLETNIPVVPLGIIGAIDVMPPNGKIKVKKLIKLNIGKPLFFKEELKLKNYKDTCINITNKVMTEIKKLVYEN